MNIHSFHTSDLGHFVLFINYTSDTVVIRDPENKNSVAVSYSDLKKKFERILDNDEIGQHNNTVTGENKNKNKYSCPNCNHLAVGKS
jgi:hypothetical protein